jgi:hypothetical protein
LYQGIAFSDAATWGNTNGFSRWGIRPRWQRLKPIICSRAGMPEQAAEKLVLAAESQPQALKRGRF